MRNKKRISTLLSLMLCGATVAGQAGMAAPIIAAEPADIPAGIGDREIDTTGTWKNSDVTWYLLTDGTLYLGPGKLTGELDAPSLANYVTRIESDPELDTSGATSLYDLFGNWENLEDISGLANWDVSNVTQMYGVFHHTKIKNTDALKNWNVSSVTSLNSTFQSCPELADLSGLANWDVSSVKNMNGTFENCPKLTNLHGLENWKTTSLDSMSGTFEENPALTDISALADWEMGTVSNFVGLFRNCDLRSVEACKKWDVSNSAGMAETFKGNVHLKSLKGLEDWDITNLHTFSGMVEGCTELTDISALNNWTFAGMNKDLTEMFLDTAVDEVDLSNWDTSKTYVMANNHVIFSTTPTKFKLSTAYMSSKNQNKHTLLKGTKPDTYGDEWVSEKLDGPFATKAMFTSWTDEMSGWWGRAVNVTLSDGNGNTVTQALPAKVEATLPTEVEAFNAPAAQKIVGWKDAQGNVVTTYTVALDAKDVVLEAVWASDSDLDFALIDFVTATAESMKDAVYKEGQNAKLEEAIAAAKAEQNAAEDQGAINAAASKLADVLLDLRLVPSEDLLKDFAARQ